MVKRDSDKKLDERIDRLHSAVRAWAQRNDLWHEAFFRRVVKSFDFITGSPTVTTLYAAGELAKLAIYPGMGAIHEAEDAQRLSDECQKLIESHGFYREPFDEGTIKFNSD